MTFVMKIRYASTRIMHQASQQYNETKENQALCNRKDSYPYGEVEKGIKVADFIPKPRDKSVVEILMHILGITGSIEVQ